MSIIILGNIAEDGETDLTKPEFKILEKRPPTTRGINYGMIFSPVVNNFESILVSNPVVQEKYKELQRALQDVLKSDFDSFKLKVEVSSGGRYSTLKTKVNCNSNEENED